MCIHNSVCHSETVLPSRSWKESKDSSSHVSIRAQQSILLKFLFRGQGQVSSSHPQTVTTFHSFLFLHVLKQTLVLLETCLSDLLSFTHSLKYNIDAAGCARAACKATADF